MSNRSRNWVVGSLVAVLALSAVIVVPTLAGAQETTTTTAVGQERTGAEERIRRALDNLVSDGTITSAQADAVAEDLASQWRAHRPALRRFHAGIDTIATAIGISEADLWQNLREGQTIAEVAADNGIEAQTVIDALVAEITERVDAAVEAGNLSDAEATQIKANAVERATAIVNKEWPPRPQA